MACYLQEKIKFVVINIVRFFLVTSLPIMFIHSLILAQEESSVTSDMILEKNKYESLCLQVENLLLLQPQIDSLAYFLLSDAENFSSNGDWEAGYEILTTIIDLYGKNTFSQTPDSQKFVAFNYENLQIENQPAFFIPSTPKGYLQIEVGIDYSQQEFELSFLENDSTILEELQNPYMGILYNHHFKVNNQAMTFNHRLRLDNQFFYYNFFGAMESRFINGRSKFEVEGYYYKQQSQLYSDFLDGQFRYSWNKMMSGRNSLFFNFRSRYKKFIKTDSINLNIVSGSLSTYFEHFLGNTSSISLNIIPEIYREEGNLGLKYFQNRIETFLRIRNNYNQFLEASIAAIYRDFSNRFVEENYQNRYWSFNGMLRSEFAIVPSLAMGLRFVGEKRNYAREDEVYTDYFYGLIEGISKFYFNSFQSFGLGYFWESQNNQTTISDLQLLAEQENFISQGIIVFTEIISHSGLILNLEYRLGWRNYPNSISSPFSNYYSDRIIHSITALGWIPLTHHWQLQIFANYDNDQDRENENNNNRSTIINLGLVYRF